MNHVIGYAELLQEEFKERGQEELIPGLKQIQAAGQQLLALINRNLNPAELGKGNLSSPRLYSELCAPIDAIVGLSEALQEEVRGRDQEALLPDLQNIRDLNMREVFVFAPLVIVTLWLGIYPGPFLEVMDASVVNLVEQHRIAMGALDPVAVAGR